MGKTTRTAGPGREIIEQMIKQSGTVSRVGFFPSAEYPDGQKIAEVAQWMEYGVPAMSIPSRSFMRTTIDERLKAWRKIVQDGTDRVSEGKITIQDVMEGVGGQAAGDCRKKISSIMSPPLSPITMMVRKYKKENGQDAKIGGKLIGQFARELRDLKDEGKEPDFDGVSSKPLNDTGAMLAHLTHMTVKE